MFHDRCDKVIGKRRPTRCPGACGGNAFSLLEIVVWLAMAGLCSLIGARMFQGMAAEFRAKRAVREVGTLLEWARWEAVRRGEVLRVAFDAEKKRVTVLNETEGGKLDESVVVRRVDLQEKHPGVLFGTAREIRRTSGCKPVDPSGIHLRDRVLRFLPTGIVDRSGSIYLIPQVDWPDVPDRMFALSILLATGRVQLWRYDLWMETDCDGEGGWVPVY
jgi:hypothetical protein